jgi:UDP-2,4-diacetamido-2,4,6-trideoxy-beta-L-altropyranose hydrolase
MKVLFRVDASAEIGSGHLVRCLALASALRDGGASVVFVCQHQPDDLLGRVPRQGFTLHRLSEAVGGPSPSAWRADAEATIRVIDEACFCPDWIVVDHYGLDGRWECTMRTSAGRICVIDDLADRQHDCDLLLNQNLADDPRARYMNLVPPACRLLLGPRYALLQPEYGALHDCIPARQGSVRRILIFTSAADSGNLAGCMLAAFFRLDRHDLEADVVVAPSSPHVGALRSIADGCDRVRIHSNSPTLAHLMARADLAIGAAGTTSWERLCLGLPALVVTMAEHQRAVAEQLEKRGLVRWIGHIDTVDAVTIGAALEKVVASGLDVAWSERCRGLVDGRGTLRARAAMSIEPVVTLAARRTRLQDEWLAPVDDAPRAKSASLSAPETVALACGRSAFVRRLQTGESGYLFTVENDSGVPIGQVACQRAGGGWRVSHSLASACPPELALAVRSAAVARLRRDTEEVVALAPDGPASVPEISVCTEPSSWIHTLVPELLTAWLDEGHSVSWGSEPSLLPAGSVCFYLGYGRIVSASGLARFANNLVVHESDLPRGRGWSPLIWQVLEGADEVVVSLFEAVAEVDAGPVYLQERIRFRGDELLGELRRLQADVTFRLCRTFVSGYPGVVVRGRPQAGKPTYYRRRTPADGRIDLDQPLRAQFNLLRTCDNDRHPAWFEAAGVRYRLRVERDDDAARKAAVHAEPSSQKIRQP